MYTFQQTSSGNIQVMKNGQIVATTTPQQAALQYGYGQNQPNPQTTSYQTTVPGTSIPQPGTGQPISQGVVNQNPPLNFAPATTSYSGASSGYDYETQKRNGIITPLDAKGFAIQLDANGKPMANNPNTGQPIPNNATPTLQFSGLNPSTSDPANFVYSSPSSTPSSEKSIEQLVQEAVEAAVASGMTPNPNLTPEDLAAVDPAQFISQAESVISPYYKQKFDAIKSDLNTAFSRMGVDLGIKVADIGKEEVKTRAEGQETLAGRGLAFSGQRQTFETDLTAAAEQQRQDARDLTFRSSQDLGTEAERQLGSAELGTANLPSIQGQVGYTPTGGVLGSLQGERQFAVGSMAQELERQARERRAYATSSLSFSS